MRDEPNVVLKCRNIYFFWYHKRC